MAAKTKYRVKAILMVVRSEGGEQYLDRSTVLPDSVSTEDIKRYLADGLIEKYTVEEVTGNDPAAQAAAEEKAKADAQAKAEADEKAKADAAAKTADTKAPAK